MNGAAPDRTFLRRMLRLPQDRPWVGLVMLAVIFISGALVGLGMATIFHPYKLIGSGKTMEEYRDQMAKELAAELDLAGPQTEEVRKIVGRQMEHYIEISKRIEPEKEISMEVFRRDVHAVLKNSQRDKWEEVYARLYQRWLRKPPPPLPATRPASQP